jgi:hypothetical protein
VPFTAMDFLTLEVDGSLANPYAAGAAGAVAVWTACLSALAIVFVRSGTRRSSGHHFLPGVLFIIGLLVTKPAQLLIGNVLYWIVDQRLTSIGFWGGPPIWIAPVVSCFLGSVTWFHVRRRGGGPGTNRGEE